MAKISILGIKIDRIDTKKTLLKIEKFIKSKKPHQIVTVNPEFVMQAKKDKEFKNVLNNADLSVPDGMGIIWASKILKKPLPTRIAGTDLVYDLAKLSSKKNYKIYFLGAEEGIAEKAISNLKKKYKNLKIAGYEAGSPYDLSTIERIKKTRPDILLVAFGAPKQDKWIYKFKNSLGVPVMMGIGGAFDFIAGKVPRAPETVRRIGFEWLYRLIKQPRRFKRQMSVIKFGFTVLGQRIKK